MADFIDRQEEINALNSLLGEDEGQFAIVYGRRLRCYRRYLWVSEAF